MSNKLGTNAKINNKTVHFYYVAAKLGYLFKIIKLFNGFFGILGKKTMKRMGNLELEQRMARV